VFSGNQGNISGIQIIDQNMDSSTTFDLKKEAERVFNSILIEEE
jgi:hypothetical protein